jgi:hypothetical protein
MDMLKVKFALVALLFNLGLWTGPVLAQERAETPYFVTYDHHMEEPGALEIEANAIRGKDQIINTFVGADTEFEYGIRRWWTTELYLDWQHTQHEGGLFTGFRIENRFLVFQEEHRINPVLYVEYEHLNGADKTLKEIVGFDNKEDLAVPNALARLEKEHEIETKLILSSDIGEWNLSENIIGTKNVHGQPWEFGYTVGLSRPLAARTGKKCSLCAESFVAGVELYGGLGTWDKVTVRGTSQYLAPVVGWDLPSETLIHVSPGWGLTDQSVGTLFRIGVTQEIDNFGSHLARLFHRK